VFLHRLVPGGTDQSYGIHVAELAGLPGAVVDRARAVLGRLEGEHRVAPGTPPAAADPEQLGFFAGPPAPSPDPALEELRNLDLDEMTPREALSRLADLQERAGGAKSGPRGAAPPP